MTNITTKPDSSQPAAEMAVDLFDNWFDPIETEVRARAHEFIEELIRGELDAVLARPRYGRSQKAGKEESAGVAGHRHGSRTRSLTGTFGPIEIAVPRARLNTPEGKTTEWKSQALRAYQRRTLAADALIASTYLAGTNTRRVRRAILDGTVVRVRLDRKATSISLARRPFFAMADIEENARRKAYDAAEKKLLELSPTE
jgi:putative transposase